VNTATIDLSGATSIEMPDVWTCHQGTKSMLLRQLAEPGGLRDCTIRRFGAGKRSKWTVTANGREILWGCADLADTGKKRHRATKRV